MSLSGKDTKVLQAGDAEPKALAPGEFRIYNMRFCPWAQRALIYAAAKKVPAQIVNIHLQKKPEWYFNKHFKGQVPTLEHDGKCVIESAVIPEYLDDIFPENRILPSDPYQKVQQKLLLERLVAIAPAFYALMTIFKDQTGKEEKYEKVVKALEDAESLLTAEFFSGTSKPGFVDYLIYPNYQRIFWGAHVLPEFPLSAEQFPGAAKFPKLTKWYHTVENLPEVIEGSQPKELGLGFLGEYAKGNPDYDYGI